jgi:tRNA(Ile)-lysidine synthase
MKALPIAPVEANGLLAPIARFSHLALAVSGGPDSLAMMHLAACWAASRASAPKLTVLTVDHGLRAASRDEAALVARHASRLGLPHAILNWQQKEARGASLQARARVARYDLMAAYCHAQGIPALLTAHTLEDQAETFVMRLKRGSGIDGLAAIPERGNWAGIAVLRPLLDVAKARLVATLEEAGIDFVSDPSNADPSFERVRVRRSTAALTALGLTSEAIALSARRLRRARAALDAAAQDFLAARSEMNEAGYASIERNALTAAQPEIALRALAHLIGAVGGGETPLQLAKLEALLAGLQARPDRTHTLGRCRLEMSSGRLGIFREARGSGLPVMTLRPGEGMLWDNRFSIALGAKEREPVLVRALGEPGLRELRGRQLVPPSIPRLAGRTLPACWREDTLIGLPLLGLSGLGRSSVDCRAAFVGGSVAEKTGGTATSSSR